MGSNLQPVRDALDNAREAGITEAGEGSGGSYHKALPEDCPVSAVGTGRGMFYFLTALGELRELKADQVANKHIVALFAPRSDYLFAKWPRKKEVKTVDKETGEESTEWVVTGWRTDDVSMLLMDAAASKGVWDARERVRGRGGWQADDGSLVLHAGGTILHGNQWREPGLYEGMVYPTQPSIPRPASRLAEDATAIAPKLTDYLDGRADRQLGEKPGAGKILLELFRCWKFHRSDIDPLLLLGWNAVAPYGGALDYRPVAWLTGDKATGKSSLQKAIGLLHGNGILQSPDATEASVRQILGQQSLPVAIDEAEADEDNRKMLLLVKLARLAATSQGNILRGGQDHQGHEFNAKSCFLFSSILIPPIPPQDKSRLSVLELQEIEAGAREPPLDKRELAELGEQLRRVMAERWPLWPARLAAFRNAMIDIGGHANRIADQFGTLLAGAHLLLSEAEPSAAELEAWARKLSVDRLTEVNDNASEADRCIQHLVTKQVQLDHGGRRRTVGEWLLQSVKKPDRSQGYTNDVEAGDDRRRAEEALGRIGMRIFLGKMREGATPEKPSPVPGREYVAIASEHQGLAELFRDSRWNNGVWPQALRRAKGAIPYERQRIGGRLMACTLVPIDEMVIDELEAEQAEKQAQREKESAQ